MLHPGCGFALLRLAIAVHGAALRIRAIHRCRNGRWAGQGSRLSEKSVRAMNCSCGGGNCYRLVDLHGARVVLVRRLIVLLTLTVLALPLLGFALREFLLLRSMLGM